MWIAWVIRHISVAGVPLEYSGAPGPSAPVQPQLGPERAALKRDHLSIRQDMSTVCNGRRHLAPLLIPHLREKLLAGTSFPLNPGTGWIKRQLQARLERPQCPSITPFIQTDRCATSVG